MQTHIRPAIHAMDLVGPVLVALVYICACSFFREPSRRNFNAIMIAGAGAAYLNGGFGVWEFAFTAMVTYFAYRGLRSYNFIGIGWLLHTGWDVLHHLYGNPIVPFAPTSSAENASHHSVNETHGYYPLAVVLWLLPALIRAARVLPSTPPLFQSVERHAFEGQFGGFSDSGIHLCPQTSQTATLIVFHPMPPL